MGRSQLAAAFWIGVYLLAILAPLVFALIGETPDGRGFLFEFSIALGFIGMSMLCLQFALTARFRRLNAPYGIDLILQFHRKVSFLALGFIVLHPLVLIALEPYYLTYFNLRVAPLAAQFGVLSVISMLIVIGTSVAKEKLKLRYETWRTIHATLAVVAVAAALFHMLAVGHYLSTPWKRTLWALIILCTIALLFYVRILKPITLLNKPYRVEKLIPERGNSWTIVLKPVGHQAFRFQPGQFAWLTLGKTPFAIEDHPISFSSSAETTDRIELTIKELGDFSSKIKNVKPDDRAFLDGPYGVFTPDRFPHAPGFVFVAGGVGITPFISMLRTFSKRGDKRPVTLFYASKRWEDITFRDELEKLALVIPLKTVTVLENPPENWTQEKGILSAEILKRHFPKVPPEPLCFLCGPPPYDGRR